MCKKWAYYVRLACALFCISCTPFLNTLQVNANVNTTTGSNLFSSTSGITNTLTLYVNPDYDALDISSATYSGSSTGSYSGSSTGTTSSTGTVNSSTTYWDVGLFGTISGTQSITLTGIGSESGTTSSLGTYSGTINRLTVSGTATNNSQSFNSSSGSYVKPSTMNSSSSGSISSNDVGSTNSTDNGSISITTTHGGSTVMHFHLPYFFGQTLASGVGDLDLDKYYRLNIIPLNFTSVGNIGHVSNISILDSKGNIIHSRNVTNHQRNLLYLLGSELYTYGSNDEGYWGLLGYLDFDFMLESINQAMTLTITPQYHCDLYLVKDQYQSSVGNNVTSDTYTHKQLEISNETQSDTNTTTHSIFDSISAFFGSFFSNLIGVFVPEDGYFTTWFNNLNSLLEAKLGILYYPFSKVIEIINRLITAFNGSPDTTITFPAIEFSNSATGETYTFLSAQTVVLNDYNISTTSSANSTLIGTSGWGSLINIIRNLNGFVLVFALLSLLRQKLNLILRGDDNDS